MTEKTNFNRGIRVDGEILPSVSSILDPLIQQHRYQSLRTYRRSAYLLENRPRKRDRKSAATRGTELHGFAREYMLNGELRKQPRKLLLPYWEPLKEELDGFDQDRRLWVEGPLHDALGYHRCGNKSAIWSKQHSYAGCPDFILSYGGVPVLTELKTTSHENFRKDIAALQTAAYIHAWNESHPEHTLNTGMVLQALPGKTNLYIIQGDELSSYIETFLELANKTNVKRARQKLKAMETRMKHNEPALVPTPAPNMAFVYQ